jgi:ribose 5-phosphate isomerase A
MDLADLQASSLLPWPEQVVNLEAKLRVAERLAARARDGECIGFGSGSATYLALLAIGRRAQHEKLGVSVVTSSYETAAAAARLGLVQRSLGDATPDWSIDGADEVDRDGRVLKGRGGALFREKMLWSASPKMTLAIDSSKRVERLGSRFPLPIEVHPHAVTVVARFVEEHGCTEAKLRIGTGKDGPVITELGCLILDARFEEVPRGLADQLKRIPGVIETGLFEGWSFEVADET